MTSITTTPSAISEPANTKFQPWLRPLRYLLTRLVVIVLTLAAGVYISVIFANLGGYVDKIAEAGINESLDAMGQSGFFRDVKLEDFSRVYEETRQQLREAAGLNQPFLIRCLRWTWENLHFKYGNPAFSESFAITLTIFGTASFILFFASLLVSLALSLRYGSWLDRLMVALSPLSAAPSWVHGVILVMIFAIGLHILPYGGLYDIEVPATRLGYVWMRVRHFILPVLAVVLSVFFQLVYTWRTYFLIYSGEDYVEVARAKGMPESWLQNRYILRPTLPYIITSFSLLVLGFWQSQMALEVFFGLPGLGMQYINSIHLSYYSSFNVMTLLTFFAYLLAITLFLLDIFNVLVDPRISASASETAVRGLRPRWNFWRDVKQVSFRKIRFHPPSIAGIGSSLAEGFENLSLGLKNLAGTMGEIRRYPSAIVGLAIIVIMLLVALGAMIAIPYDQAINYWVRDPQLDHPSYAPPAWMNFFRKDKLPESVVMDSREQPGIKTVERTESGLKKVTLTYSFDYPYDGFPQDISLFMYTHYKEKRPHITLFWDTPDGTERELASFSITSEGTYVAGQDEKLQRRLSSKHPQVALFLPEGGGEKAVRGKYTLRASALLFEPDADLEARFVLYGQVYGVAGTDHMRRDLLVALLWGAPIALGAGFLGAVISSLASMTLAAFGVWYGGAVDGFVQRLSEINMMIPMLPIGIMVYYIYSKNIWIILLVIIVFTVFGSPLRTYRAAFLQVKEASYIAAAQAYGAGNLRIISAYMVPRILPILVPQLVATIPGFIFLEATLAILGVSDLNLPTWGKVIYNALDYGAFNGKVYWIAEPIGLLLLAGIGFALVGFALDRVFNPRLRNL